MQISEVYFIRKVLWDVQLESRWRKSIGVNAERPREEVQKKTPPNAGEIVKIEPADQRSLEATSHASLVAAQMGCRVANVPLGDRHIHRLSTGARGPTSHRSGWRPSATGAALE